MNTSPSSEFPVVIAFRSVSPGFSYSLLFYRGAIHLAEFRQGALWRFLRIDRGNFCLAFGEQRGKKIWQYLVAMRHLKGE